MTSIYFHGIHWETKAHARICIKCSFKGLVEFFSKLFLARLLRVPYLYRYTVNDKCEGWGPEWQGKKVEVEVREVYFREPSYIPSVVSVVSSLGVKRIE